ncbi:glycoside hydrolase family 97 protein [Chryseobacterium sp. LAM-KRS1]|uniref:glycoside hydrolase family 97 protein n=1 Tax=Chryseobacterium sp. LAM-KRS1 TaxID=2715754 RepID=UPI0015564212|nr:glycoside hydrolase family 97 protein [Chryseobacterium sp. LAM-KRS1]
MKKNDFIIFILFCLILLPTGVSVQKQLILTSPNNKLKTFINVGKTVEYSLLHNGDVMLDKSAISMTLDDGSFYGKNGKLLRSSEKKVNQTFNVRIYKRQQIKDYYNELILEFKDYHIIFRAYDEGIAYRFVSLAKKPFKIMAEQAEFNFPADQKAFINYTNKPETAPLEKQFFNSFEQPYFHYPLSEWNKKRLAINPLLVEGVKGKKLCIAESDLINYPGMFLYPGDKSNSLKGVFAPYPKEVQQGGHNNLQMLIKSRENFVAQFDKGTDFPWRIIIISEKDSDLTDSDIVYKLATPSQGDYSWVKPGKVAWDWWNDWNLYNVNFKTGVNNETYRYYIDFAAQYGIEYVILDEGWAVNKKADLFQVVPEINLPELIAYANSKKVGLILWAGYYAFDRDMEAVCKHYSEMGIKGFKVDFMDRDDQIIVDFHRRGAAMASKYKLLIDYHGTYKPTGLQRTYPNVINFEGVNGLEQMKWADHLDQVTYDVTIPFIRQIAGPMDYTQGAMRNATKDNFKSVDSEAMSQGTRCRQLAEYIVFESPLNMLCDSPSNYMAETECTEFIAKVPTIWDQTIALDGEVAKYVAIARKKGDDWYMGALTNWDARTVELDLSFLGKGNFKGEVFKDGINANRVAKDYKKEVIDIPANRKLTVSMASGGGYVIKITKK